MIADIWRIHQLIVFGGLSIAIPIFFITRIGLTATAFWIYLLLSSLWVFQNPWAHGPFQFRLDQSASQAFAIALMLPMFTVICMKRWLPNILRGFEGIALLDGILVLILGYGMFNAHSVDSSFVASVFVMAVLKRDSFFNALPKKLKILVSIVILASILRYGGSTGIIILAVGLLSSAFFERKITPWVLVPIAVLGYAGLMYGAEFLSSSGRVDAWQFFMNHFWTNENIFFGTGIGTFEWIGPILQNRTNDLFVWMHNEYLQVLFEGGLLGLGLALSLLFVCFRQAIRNQKTWLFSTLVCLSVMSLTQFPFRFAVSALFICFVVRSAVDDML